MGDVRTLEEADEVWSWGAGTSGQLGNGKLDDELLPKRAQQLDEEQLKQIACGGSHAVGVTDDGRVFTWGSNPAEGPNTFIPAALPQPLEALSGIKIVKVAAGWAHTALITDDGKVLTYGEGQYGQLGLGTRSSVVAPSVVEALASVRAVDVACGLRHTLVLVEDASGTSCVRAFGAGKRGQLGVSSPTLVATRPVTVDGLNGVQVRAVSAAGDHSAALTVNGDLMAWGRGYLDAPDMHVPIRIGRGKKWSHMALGWSHGLALADEGGLWAWGSNRYGQLGTGASAPGTLPSPSAQLGVPGDPSPGLNNNHKVEREVKGAELKQIPFFVGRKVTGIAAGAEHSAAVTDSGEVFTWGWAEHGQLGLGDTQDRDTPQLLAVGLSPSQTRTSAQVYCGSGFTFVVLRHRQESEEAADVAVRTG
ncbi:hypothetical protein KFL_001030110 [Klebsormidium nitens]|uniref:RCC1-like domain-containing protein n=1 Tax=Klebsormidium nitens TaxID=105231 RepID=A0A1Y1I086_KLENI|nr:hypothetical protein KFL_001030110 [Klebsormidium nitens]|eukprot:GAQ82186.1 hypothetical protein KFL_001030110 [Klebsormidium nitens]